MQIFLFVGGMNIMIKIKHSLKISDIGSVTEIFMDYDGCSYVVIYGTHINGRFIALPAYGKSCEAGEPWDIFLNCKKLEDCGFVDGTAEAIAQAIKECC